MSIRSISKHPHHPPHYRATSILRLLYAAERRGQQPNLYQLARIADKYLWTERLLASQITAQQLGFTLYRKKDISRYKYYKAPRIRIGRLTFALIRT